ncbi:MAG: hypothetical protein WAP51_01830 [Candidatus Sungiibacteriota bacterium]
MIYLIYGPDTFRSRCLLSDIIDEFKKKAGTDAPAIFRFDAEEDAPERLLQFRSAQSLFGSKELIVVERLFSSPKSKFSAVEPLLEQWQKSQSSIFVFWDDGSGEDEAIERVKKHSAKIQEFQLLAGAKLERWLDDEISAKGLKLSSAEQRALIADSGGDLWKLTRELDKHELGGVAPAKKEAREEKIWNFTDAFLVSKKQALAASFRLVSRGADNLYLIGALARTLRVTFAIRDALDRKIQISEIGKKMKVHPYVVKKQAESARVLTQSALARNYGLLLTADENIKTGKLPAPIAFLNLFVK